MSLDTPNYPSLSSPTAFLAEDDDMIRDIVSLYLQRLGFAVLEAESGAAALRLIEQAADPGFDLLVTDLLMPGASGDAVIERARSRGLCERFMIISGFADQLDAIDPELRAQAVYLEKPFTFAAFEAKIGELMHPAL